jgi:4-hydroxymandelate oxidase
LPVLVAPTAFHRLAHPEGELATARATSRAGTILILSTLSTTAMEEVVSEATQSVWFQLYFYRDREATADLVRRAETAGCSAIVLTVDAQLWGVRERDVRNRFQLPDGLSMPNLTGGMGRIDAADADSGLAAYVGEMFDPSLSWKHVEWLASLTDLPVLVKGVVHPEDARLAVEHGAAGVIVSNHGGRQLDTSVSTIDALPAVVEAAHAALARENSDASDFVVLIDGGIRRGTDVVKAIALGADAVCVGRPVLWGLAVEGEEGVFRVMELLRGEFDAAMGLCGATSPDELREMGHDLIG